MPRSWSIVAVGAVLILGGGFTYYYWPESAPLPPPPLAEALPPELKAQFLIAEATPDEAAGAETIALTFQGHGFGQMRVTVKNRTLKAAEKTLTAGTILERGSNRAVLLRDVTLAPGPGATVEQELTTAALDSGTSLTEGDYVISEAGYAALLPLIEYLKTTPADAVTPGALQVAVLAVVEDAPLGVFAKFPRLRPDPLAIAAGEKFKVETADILAALTLLREAGIDIDQLAIGSDSQLKIEAMVDPVSHLAALRFYGITEADEWSFWKNHLLTGDAATRHYALYGIGRYYPGIALEMMPRWAVESRLQPVMRRSAINSLGATHRAEALGILSYLEDRLTDSPELQMTARKAGAFLEQDLGGASDTPSGTTLGAITR